MEVTWIEHNGRKVLFSNYEGCKTSEEMIGILYKEAEILMGQEGKVLVMALKLVDLQDKNHPAAVRSGFAYTTGILFSFAAIGGSLLLESQFHNLGLCGIVAAALCWLIGWRKMGRSPN